MVLTKIAQEHHVQGDLATTEIKAASNEMDHKARGRVTGALRADEVRTWS